MTQAQQIIDAAKISMGQDLSEADVVQVKKFAVRVVEQIDFRGKLQDYLRQRMNAGPMSFDEIEQVAIDEDRVFQIRGAFASSRICSRHGDIARSRIAGFAM